MNSERIVTCACPKCLTLPKELRRSGKIADMVKVKLPSLANEKNVGSRYMHPDCIQIRPYHGERQCKTTHKPNKDGIKIGFELEGSFPTYNDYARCMNGIYGFVPTRDSSIDGYEIGDNVDVEFNTPIYCNLSGIQSMMRSMEDAHFHTKGNNTGHHINISGPTLNTLKWRHNFEVIIKIGEWLRSNPEICKACFGREICHYANVEYSCNDKYSFINVSHNNRIEFRIPRYLNARQYILTTFLCKEIYQTIEKFIGTVKQEQIPTKVIRILQSFAKGERTYQRRQTDEYANGSNKGNR